MRRAKEESELSLDQAYVGYAESTDGIHFDKPELHLIDEGGSTANNVVIPSKLGGSSVWIDPHAPPEERYKNQSKVYNPEVAMQFHMHGSPDGIHWKFLRRIQLPHRGGWDTQSIIFWDPAIGRYVLYTRRWVAKRHTTAEGNENYHQQQGTQIAADRGPRSAMAKPQCRAMKTAKVAPKTEATPLTANPQSMHSPT